MKTPERIRIIDVKVLLLLLEADFHFSLDLKVPEEFEEGESEAPMIDLLLSLDTPSPIIGYRTRLGNWLLKSSIMCLVVPL